MNRWHDITRTLTSRILLFVEAWPGRTAWGIAQELSSTPKRDTGTISSLLCRMARDGRVVRRKGMRGSWTYHPARKA